MKKLFFIFVLIIVLIIALALIFGLFSIKDIQPVIPILDTAEKCKFLATDIINGHVYDNYGNMLENVNTNVKCKECKDYLYKSYDGCSRYNKESRLMDEDGFISLCTSISFPKACELEFKTIEPEDPSQTDGEQTLDFRKKIAEDEAERVSEMARGEQLTES